MAKLKVGQKAPDFTLADQNSKKHRLADCRGGWVLVYFYPKDNTPGCTVEACAIRDSWNDFEGANCLVLGISVDPVKSHKKFAGQFNLPFPLLADEKKEVVKKYGVWAKKKFMGKEYLGTLRTSFLINPQGKIAKIYENVKPEIHADQVLGDLRKIK